MLIYGVQPLSLVTGQAWADRMFDASAKLPAAGILAGNFHFPGSFDACLAVVAPEFQTKMAMVTLGSMYGGGGNGARAARSVPGMEELKMEKS